MLESAHNAETPARRIFATTHRSVTAAARSFALLMVCWLPRIAAGAIEVNAQQSFDARPSVLDWSTKSVPGGGLSITTPADLDIAVQTNSAADITNELVIVTLPIGLGRAQWSSSGRYLATRPAGNAYTLVMATITNSTGGNLSSLYVSFDFNVPTPMSGEDPGLAGFRTYYSLTGTAYSWVLLPELTGATTPGALLTALSVGSWPAGSVLYLLWADDNGGPGGDGPFSIDNFLVGPCLAPPTIIQQPVSLTNVLQGRVAVFTVTFDGCRGTVGATYRWHRVGGGPIDTNINPSAMTSTLVITHAQLTDTGDYYVVASDIAGSVISANAHLEVIRDNSPPRFLRAEIVPGSPHRFRLVVDEPVCVDALVCGGNAANHLAWQILGGPDFSEDLGVLDVQVVDGTNLLFLTAASVTPTRTYRIAIWCCWTIADLFWNMVPDGTFAETLPTAISIFQQGIGGYAGTQDAEIHSEVFADTPLGTAAAMKADLVDAGVAQCLLRFDNLFGNGPSQIPPWVSIRSATLTLTQVDPGSAVHLHRMLVPWDQMTVTWNSLMDGILPNTGEAVIAPDATIFTGLPNGRIDLDVTASLQAWADDQPNYGWALLSTGSDSSAFNTSESGVSTAPFLAIAYDYIGDALPLYLTGAAAESDGVTVTLNFSSPLNAASAQHPANYTLTPSLAVVSAVLTSNSTVTLTTAPREFASNYSLRMANITDNSAAVNLISPNPTFVTLTSARIVLSWNADSWRYNTNNLDATPDWKHSDFTPGADWGTGAGFFGAETGAALAAAPAPIATPLTPNSVADEFDRHVTTYFRRTIDLPTLPAGARYVIGHYVDDGFIAYLDGEEIHRFAMSAGAVTFTNRSTGIPTGDATMRSFSFTATPGPHTLAVELHQAGTTSTDVFFGMDLRIMGGISPGLSIARSVNGDVNLSWNADDNWRLRSAAALTGPYLDVLIPLGSRHGRFTLPPASEANGNQFLRLDYICRP